jgi:hypothetical protein
MDALSPAILRDLIVAEINSIRDPKLWREAEARQWQNSELISAIPANWHEIRGLLERLHRQRYVSGTAWGG